MGQRKAYYCANQLFDRKCKLHDCKLEYIHSTQYRTFLNEQIKCVTSCKQKSPCEVVVRMIECGSASEGSIHIHVFLGYMCSD